MRRSVGARALSVTAGCKKRDALHGVWLSNMPRAKLAPLNSQPAVLTWAAAKPISNCVPSVYHAVNEESL